MMTIGSVHGGTKSNIIADEVVMESTNSTLEKSVSNKISQSIEEILKGFETSYNCKCKFDIDYGYPVLVNNNQFIDEIAIPAAAKIVGEENIVSIPEPSMGAEDFAYYLEKAPGVMGALGARNEAKGITAGGHNSYFNIDEDCLWIGAATLAQAAWEFLSK